MVRALGCLLQPHACGEGPWRHRPPSLVMDKFEWEGDRKDFVEHQLSNSFRNYRHRLKKQFFDPFPTAEERIAHRPHDISVEDWDYLCNLWNTSEFQALSSKNKVNRLNLEMNHPTGRRSFAQIEVDQIAKTGKIPSRLDMFELTRKRKKGGWIDKRAEEVAAQMRELCDHTSREEVHTSFLGPDRSGKIQCKGWRRAITNHGSEASHEGLIQRCDDARREVEEARKCAELAEKRAAAAEGRAEAAEKKAALAEFSAAEAKESCSMMQKQVLALMTELRSMMTHLPLVQHSQNSQRQSSEACDDQVVS